MNIKYTTYTVVLLVLCMNFKTSICENLHCQDEDHPNILLFVVDDLRPTLGCYSDLFAITPNIDQMADEGIAFTKAFAQQALCGPSRTSFLTSRRPDTTHLVDVHYYWRKHAGNFTTLPQYFKEYGYVTQSVGKIFHPGITSNYTDDQPFSWLMTPYHPSTQKYKNAPVCLSSNGKLHSNIYCPVQVDKQPEKTLPDIQSTEFSLKWLHQYFNKGKMNDSKKPFFLAVGLHKPHIPLKFPMEFLDLYPIDSVPLPPNQNLPRGLPLVAWNPWNDLRRREDISALNISFPFGPIPDYYSKYIRQGYYAATTYIDSLIGLIVSQTKFLFPNTIMALIGDHGWSLGEHQEWSKFSNFEVATRVPFIISLQCDKPLVTSKQKYILKQAQKTRVTSKYFKKFIKTSKKFHKNRSSQRNNKKLHQFDGVVELIDLFPTLVDLAGLPALQECPVDSSNVSICTEGQSLSCIIIETLQNRIVSNGNEKTRNPPSCPYKTAALSQYPRPGVHPSANPDSDQPRLTETKIMGYSLRTNRYRYTSWLRFNHSTFGVDFTKIYGQELYDHLYDEEENNNLLSFRLKRPKTLKKLLKFYLKQG